MTLCLVLFSNKVQYDVRGILEKNRDTFRDDLLNLLRESRYVYWGLFQEVVSKQITTCANVSHL